MITVSVVSHGQGELVEKLLGDLVICDSVSEIILTQNIPESEIFCPPSMKGRIRYIKNDRPLGFSANHNQAFHQSRNPLFAVVNPDIRLNNDPFRQLVSVLDATSADIIAPAVCDLHGNLEDSVRRFPTLFGLVTKLLNLSSGKINFDSRSEPFFPDWVAGMFVLFRRDAYAALGGFDEGFFLYYEDVDICVRAWQAGMKLVACPSAVVVHDARRDSHRSLRHLRWHLGSMARYFLKHLGRLPRVNQVCH